MHKTLALDGCCRGVRIDARAAEALGDRSDKREEITAGRFSSIHRCRRRVGIYVVNNSSAKALKISQLVRRDASQARIAGGESAYIRGDDFRDPIGAKFRCRAVRRVDGQFVNIMLRLPAVRKGRWDHVVRCIRLQSEKMLHPIVVCFCCKGLSKRLGGKKAIARGENSQLLG